MDSQANRQDRMTEKQVVSVLDYISVKMNLKIKHLFCHLRMKTFFAPNENGIPAEEITAETTLSQTAQTQAKENTREHLKKKKEKYMSQNLLS